MKCPICGSSATAIKETKKAKYRGETVEVATELFRCDDCKERFVTPTQMGMHVRAVKNEVRKKEGMLPPERIVEIRKKLCLTQSELENVLGTGPKMAVRWESGKVIQSRGHDNMLRLLERDPSILKYLQQIQQLRIAEQEQYDSSRIGKPASQAVASA
jgi:putative zinc finger/helix-turn-helix YgiT family protein